MSLKLQRARQWLAKHTRHPKQAFPMATVIFYGPTASRATKIVAAVFWADDQAPEALERWLIDEGDVRDEPWVTLELVDWLKDHGVQRVVTTNQILGCPHEEGIDYPEGENCPQCPYWADHDRFTGKRKEGAPVAGSEDNGPELVYSAHCGPVVHEGRHLNVHIYKSEHSDWILEVVNEHGTSTIWDEPFASDDEAYAEFQSELRQAGPTAFTDTGLETP